MLEMTAVRSTTGNYYGALRDDASDGTAETDIPDPDPEALSEASPLHHLPSEVLAVVLQYLTTAAPFLWCNSGDRLRLTRMTRRHCERDFAEYDRAFQDLGEDDQFFADGLLRTHGIVEALKYVRKKIWSPRPPRLDPAQRRICSFFPRRDGRARCWTCGGQHE